jgi:hypothetical protein
VGEIDIKEDLTDHQMDILRKRLLDFSLEMIDDKKAIIIEKIKNVIVEMVHYADEMPKINYSDYLSDKPSI